MPSVDHIRVLKRDNETVQEFNQRKIEKAIKASFNDAGETVNGQLEEIISKINDSIYETQNDGLISVENIQEIVKEVLMDSGYHKPAEHYIIYSNHRDELRKTRKDPDHSLISDYIHLNKYARHREDLGRREMFKETVDRPRQMNLKKFPELSEEINWAFDMVEKKRVVPSMRAMQYGGEAMERHNQKGYNCSFGVCNSFEFFSRAFHLLLCGTGVGFSVQWHHVDQIPPLDIIDEDNVDHHVIEDTIEGWADALYTLLSNASNGIYTEFAYHKIRSKGSPLKVSGGKAPGHIPLKKSLEAIRGVLNNASGRSLKPIECYDIMCMAADAVFAGGIREAAMICLFSIDDGEMMNAKTGNWHAKYPWRAMSNNSVVLKRDEIKKDQYLRIFKATRQWGEPGFYFTNDIDTGANPCVEIGLNPKLEITPRIKIQIEQWAKKTNRTVPDVKIGETYWGFQMCNLTEVNAAVCETEEELLEAVKAATIIGTLQASYTDFDYLGWVSEFICYREALLGVSMTGMMDSPDIALDERIQQKAAQYAVEVNMEFAEKLNINSAARVTCVKPSGSASMVLGCVGSGIHPHHARRYFRRVRTNKDNPVFQFLKKHCPAMCSTTKGNKAIITFPVKAPDGAIVRDDMTAIEMLEHVLSTMKNWVLPGTSKPNSSPGVTHNVSNTITVRNHEWDEVADFLWRNRRYFSGVSMLAYTGDKEYEDAPREAVINDVDEAKWQYLISDSSDIDWTQMTEEEDTTNLQGEIACAGGKCEI